MKKTVRQTNFFRKRENRKNRIHFLKGVGKIILSKIYSFKQKGDTIHLLCDGEKIHCFHKGVTVQIIKEYISNYKALKDYCGAPVSMCHVSKNCDVCHISHKKWAEERKKEGKKIVRPKPEDISEKRTTLSPIGSKKIFFRRSYSGKW